jgi:hypothetical protein
MHSSMHHLAPNGEFYRTTHAARCATSGAKEALCGAAFVAKISLYVMPADLRTSAVNNMPYRHMPATQRTGENM